METNKLLLSIIFSTLIASCSLQNHEENIACEESLFYYYKGDKHFSELSKNYFSLGFDSAKTDYRIETLLNSETALKGFTLKAIMTTSDNPLKMAIIQFNSEKTCFEMSLVKKALVENDAISYSNYCFLGGYSTRPIEGGSTSVFCCNGQISLKLKNDSLETNSKALLNQYNLEILRINGQNIIVRPIDLKQVSIIQTANKLYDSGLFEYSEPDFLYISF